MSKKLLSVSEGLEKALKRSFSPLIKQFDVGKTLGEKIAAWVTDTKHSLFVENPFHDDFARLENAEQTAQARQHSSEAIKADIGYFQDSVKKTNSKFDDFWATENQKIDNETKELINQNKQGKVDDFADKMAKLKSKQKSLQKLLHEQWRKHLMDKHAEWKMARINQLRQEFFAQLKSWLDLLKKMMGLCDSLSIRPGLLFDLSDGSLTNTDIEQLKRWAEYIARDDGVKKLCDMLGRLRVAERNQREELVKYTDKISVQVPDISSKEEITGVTFGKDIERAIPEELALLADDETALLFDLKYAENRIMSFEMQGWQTQEEEIEREKKAMVDDEEKMGPIIICVDTSGSMQGAQETIAKAVTLYMATRAQSQDRGCYLINFSTGIEVLDLSEKIRLKKLIDFLRMSFHGGTDVAPALHHAMETIATKNYKKADVLTISDMLMGRALPSDLQEKITAAKQQKNKFYSLCIGNHTHANIEPIFDKEWTYDPHTRSVRPLHKFISEI